MSEQSSFTVQLIPFSFFLMEQMSGKSILSKKGKRNLFNLSFNFDFTGQIVKYIIFPMQLHWQLPPVLCSQVMFTGMLVYRW